MANLPKLPVELYRLISSPTPNGGNGIRERFNTAQALAGLPEGQRDDAIFRLACKLRSADVPQDMAESLIVGAARNCDPLFPEDVALEKVARAYTKYEPKSEEKKAPASTHGFKLVSAIDLLASAGSDTRWLWDGVLPEGGMSLVVGKPKAGKSTFAFALSLAVAAGREFLGRPSAAGPVVYLALEEKRAEVKKKLEAANCQVENIFFHFGAAPADAVTGVVQLIKETKAKLMIIDVLQKFIRVRDLNDYALVTNALEPLLTAARESGCHVTLTHHAGKADRPDGDEVLGSTALLGGVDTLVSIKKRDKRRTFFTIQRYGDDIPETVVELKADGALESAGSRQEVELEETIPLVLEACEPVALTEKEIWERIEKKHDIVSKAIRAAVDRGKLNRTGGGKKNDPYFYGKILSFSPQDTMGRAGREYVCGDNSKELNGKCSPDDFDLFALKEKTPGKAFSDETEPPKDPWDEDS
jgi:AAA domain